MDWHTERDLEIVAGTPAGGGLDRTARALAKAIDAHKLVDVAVRVVNVPGDGSRKAWGYMDAHRGDPHVVSISHPNMTTDRLLGLARFDLKSYTPISILYNEYIAFAARADGAPSSAADLLRRLAAHAGAVRIALSTSAGNPNHVALALVARHAGGDPRAPQIRVFDSALDAIADALAGNADVAAVTAASAIPALKAGTACVLAISAPERLSSPFAEIPTWSELGVDCTVGAWRGIAGASGIDSSHVAFWERTLLAASQTSTWHDELGRNAWAPLFVTGAELRRHLAVEEVAFAASLADLGLLPGPGAQADLG